MLVRIPTNSKQLNKYTRMQRFLDVAKVSEALFPRTSDLLLKTDRTT